MKETRKQVRLNRDASHRVKLFKTHKGWMTTGVTTLAIAAGVVTFGANTNDVSAATWKSRSVSDITDQIKTSTDKSTYTIKWGDTLSAIAEALTNSGINTTADRLAEINHISQSDLIYAGNKLTFTGTGDKAVATVKESDGTTKSYNLDPSKQATATKKDVADAKVSQKEADTKTPVSSSAKSSSTKATSSTSKDESSADDSATNTAAAKATAKASIKAKAEKISATVKTDANGNLTLEVKDDDSADNVVAQLKDAIEQADLEAYVKIELVAGEFANQHFEKAIKDKGYTFTKDDDSKYSFEIAGASDGDIEAIMQIVKYYGVTNYQFTENGVVQDQDATSDDTDTADTEEASTTTTEQDDDADVTSTTEDDSAVEASSESSASSSQASSTTSSVSTATSSTTSSTSSKASSSSHTTTTSTSSSSKAPVASSSSSSSHKTSSSSSSTKPATSKPSTSKPSTGSSTSSTSSRAAKVSAVLSVAKAQIGKPYVWGGKGPSSFDCSGLVSYAFQHGIGMNLSGNSASQATQGTRLSSLSQIQAGDLIFWSSNGRVYHVAIAISSTQYIAAPHAGENVQIQTISSYFYPSFATRVIK